MTAIGETPSADELIGTYEIDPTHSRIDLEVPFLAFLTTRCNVRGLEGTIAISVDHLTVSATVDASSFDSSNPKRDERVRSADFLHCELHPTLTVTVDAPIAAAKRTEADDPPIVVAGRVTRGEHTAPVELTVRTVTTADDRLTAKVDGLVDRTALGVSRMPGLLIGRRVTVSATLSARRATNRSTPHTTTTKEM